MSLAEALAARDLDRLPSRRAEAWRWSNLRAAVHDLPPPSPDEAAFGRSPFSAIAGEPLVLVNGRLVAAAEPPEVHSVHSVHPDLAVHARSGRHAPLRIQLGGADLQDLHDLHCLNLRILSDAVGTAHSASLSVTVAAGARALLLESYEGRGSAYVSDFRLDIHVGEGAMLERLIIADEPADAVSVATAHVAVEGGATYRQTTVASGARLQRLETHVRHPGAGASVRLDGLYVVSERRHADLTSVVTHEGQGGGTSQLTKGVVADAGRAVFQGRITVLKGADKTDARMGHHALLLSDRAEVDSKPELEIWADDVSCAHGNTVGALDEDALFYARSRGIPEAQARALMTEAFLGEVIERVQHPEAREVLGAWLERRLGGLA